MKKSLLLILTFFVFSSYAINFNQNKIISLQGIATELESDEGYLYLSLYTNIPFVDVIVKSTKFGNNLPFENVSYGYNYALIKVKAGDYYWQSFYQKKFHIKFDKTNFPFKVEAGVINYPGSWKANTEFRGQSASKFKMKTKNKTFAAMKKVKKDYPEIYNKYDFKFQGKVKDNFPDFQSRLITKHNIDEDEVNLTIQSPYKYSIKNGVKAETERFPQLSKYFNEGDFSIGEISPDGKYFVYSYSEGKKYYIIIYNTATAQSHVVFSKKSYIHNSLSDLQWIDNNSIFYKFTLYEDDKNYVIHFDFSGNKPKTKYVNLPTDGDIVNPLVDQDNVILFSKYSSVVDTLNGLYKLDSSNPKTMLSSLKRKNKVVKKPKNVFYWLTDDSNDVRFAISIKVASKKENSTLEYWFLPDKNKKKWKRIYSTKADFNKLLLPQYISKDGQLLYVLTNNFSDKNEIHTFSTNDFSHLDTFYNNDEINIEGMVTNPSQGIIGVFHIDKGFYKYKYFEQDNDSLDEMRSQYPKLHLYQIQNETDQNTVLIYGSNEYSKGSWFIYNTKSKKTVKILDEDENYNKLGKGLAQHLKIKTKEGFNIEGFLVTPNKGINKFPLIVMPHGGPKDVQDYAYNDVMQHFFASHGFASLKVNFRGSAGQGKMFLESGHGEWGNKIESDINEMVQHTIESYNIDTNRICALGSSYGGYSAIMLTMLYPDRYKCAVSLAGVTDLPLLFTSSNEFIDDKDTFKQMSDIIGNPIDDYEKLISKSPTYLVEKISKPILLFHGIYDKVVTLEHSLRLKKVMDLLGKENELLLLKNEGHSLNNVNSNIVYIARSLLFIMKHIGSNNNYWQSGIK